MNNIDDRYVKLKDPGGRAALRALKDLPHNSYELFDELLGMMDKTNALLATHDDLAHLCKVSVATLKKAIALLVKKKYIQTRRASNGNWYSINAAIATRCSRRIELYATGYELWTCKVLVNKKDSPIEFDEPLRLDE